MYRCLAIALMLLAGVMCGCNSYQGADTPDAKKAIAEKKATEEKQMAEMKAAEEKLAAEKRAVAALAAEKKAKKLAAEKKAAENKGESEPDAAAEFKEAVKEGVEAGMNDIANGIAAPIVAVKNLELDESVVKDISRVAVAKKADDPNVNAHRIDSLVQKSGNGFIFCLLMTSGCD